MWALVKAHPWTFAIGAFVLLLAAAGVVWGIVTRGRWEDRRLLKRNGHELCWARADLPLAVWYASDLSVAWLGAWGRAVDKLNAAAGQSLFLHPIEAAAGYDLTRAEQVSLCGDGGNDPDRGSTMLRWDDRTGYLLSAAITLPDSKAGCHEMDVIAVHEAAHALGLDHDEQRGSIMYPHVQGRAQELTRGDRALLRKIYG
jgi:hypothetical protein